MITTIAIITMMIITTMRTNNIAVHSVTTIITTITITIIRTMMIITTIRNNNSEV